MQLLARAIEWVGNSAFGYENGTLAFLAAWVLLGVPMVVGYVKLFGDL